MMQLIIIAAALLIAAFAARTAATASCNYLSSCPSPNTTVLFVRNDTAGYLNAHAQLPTNGSYPFALCCDFGMTVSTACPGNATFLNLSNVTNAHLQAGNSTAQAYGNGICLSTNNGSIAVTWATCPSGYTTVASISNDTNAHIGDSNEYSLKLCIQAAIRPTPAFVSPTDNDNKSISIRRNYSYVNISVANGTTIDTVIVNWNGSNVTLENTSFVSSLDLSTDLVLWLTFNNNTRDKSRYNNHGVQQGNMNCSTDVIGKYGGACALDGVIGTRINITSSNSLNVAGGNITFMAWARRLDGNSRRILWKGGPDDSAQVNYAFLFISYNLQLETYNSGWRYQTSTGTVPSDTNVWFHVAATFNGSNVSFYINGTLDSTFAFPYPLITNSQNLYIGKPDGAPINGYLDEIKIWNRTLSTSEISAEYNSQMGKYFANFTDLAEGNYTYYTWVNDTMGNVNSTRNRVLVTDYTRPTQTLVSPTEADNKKTTLNWTYINVSVVENYPDTFIVNWNGTNVTVDSSDLILALDFNNNTNDRSRYGNSVSLTDANVNCSTGVTGKFGGGCNLSGTGQSHVNVSDSPMWAFQNGSFTLMGWVNYASFGTWWTASFIAQDEGSGGVPKWIFNYDSSAQATTWHINGAQGTVQLTGNTWTASANTWYHLAITKNGSSYNFYRNGVFDGSATSGVLIPNAATTLKIGYGEGSGNLNGIVDEIRIWNRSLSGTEITASYQAELGKYFANFTSLAEGSYAYYTWLNDTAGNTNTSENRSILVDYTLPVLAFVSPTDADNKSINIRRNYTYINVTLTEANLDTFIINWNGTNVTVDDNLPLLGPINDESLVLALNFNNNTNDRSRYGNNGVLSGKTNCSLAVTGVNGTACSFDGASGYITAGSASSLTLKTNFTISFWSKLSSTGSPADYVLTKRSGQDDYAVAYGFVANKYEFYAETYTGTAPRTELTTAITSTNWNHITWTYDGTTLKGYINGTLDVSSVKSFVLGAGASTLRIATSTGGADFWDGTIDDLRIWNRTLTNAEINATIKADFGKYWFNFTNLAEGNYTYFAWANDTAGSNTSTANRVLVADFTSPTQTFVLPTAPNNITVLNWTYINVSVNEKYPDTFIVNWNGTNVTVDSSDLVLAMNFNNNTNDMSRYGNNGAQSSGVNCTTDVSGKFSGACQFDGTNDEITFSSSSSQKTENNSFTVELWAKFTSVSAAAGSNQGIITNSRSDGSGWFLTVNRVICANTSNLDLGKAGIVDQCVSYTFSPNTWYHIAAVQNFTGGTPNNASNVVFFVNGVSIGTSSNTRAYNPSAGNFNVGYQSAFPFFNGTLDEIRIWNRSLNATEIQAHYQAELGRINGTTLSYYANFTSLNDGNYTYYTWINDTAGNTNDSGTRQIEADGTPPVINAVRITSNNTGRMFVHSNSSTAARVYFNAFGTQGDGQNVTIEVRSTEVNKGNLTGNQTFSDTPLSTAATSPMFISYTIEANSTNASTLVTQYDKPGNPATITITWANDSVDPRTIDNVPMNTSGTWYNTDVNITINATDSESGVNRTYWCVYNAGTAPCHPNAMSFNTTNWVQLNCSEDSSCQWVVRYYSTDNVSNNESGGDVNGGSFRESTTIQIAKGSDINNSIVNNSNISKGSYVRDSTVINSTITACRVEASNITRSTLARNTSHRYNCTVRSSVITDTNVTSAIITNSFIDPSVIVDSVIENSNVTNGSVYYSRVENSTFCAPGIYAYEAVIRNDTLISGLVTYNSINYYGPFPLASICAGLKPSPIGVLSADPSIVNNTGIITFKYQGYGIGYNISINKSEFQTKLYNSTVSDLILPDSGDLPDRVQGDAIHTANFTMTVNNNISDGEKTIIAYIDDKLGNRWNLNVTVTLDNTKPNASIRINGGVSSSPARSVTLTVLFNDSVGIRDCRFASEDRLFDNWEACTNTKAWILSAGLGSKTVVIQARDKAGNINESNASITLVSPGGLGISPSIVYVPLTEDDRISINRNHTYINLSIANSTSIDSLIINWNGTNVTVDSPNLILALDFNNNTNDRSRYANTVTNNGSNCSSNVAGRFGSGCSFDGSDDFIQVNDNNNLHINGSITLEAWVRKDGGTNFQSIIEKGVAKDYELSLFNSLNSKVRFQINDGASWRIADSNGNINAGQWYHIAVTFNNSNVYHYINGTLDTVTSFPYTAQITTSDVLIGKRSDGFPFNGIIDNVRIWNRSLTAAEISASYNAELGKYYANFTSLKDGNYTYYAWVNDTAGASAFTETRRIAIDTVLPNATIMISNGYSNTTSSTVGLSITANDTGTGATGLQCRFANEDRNFGDWEGCAAAKAWSLSTGAGVKTVVLQAMDRAGNVNETNDTIVLVSPFAVTILQPLSSAKLTGRQRVDVVVPDDTLWVTFNVTNSSNRALSWNLAGTANAVTNDSNPNDGWNNTWSTASFADDNYNITVIAYRVDGTSAYDTESWIQVDNTAPQIGMVYPLNGSVVRGVIQLNATTSANDVVRVVFEYSNDGGTSWHPVGVDFSPVSGWTFDWNTALVGDGAAYRVRANATDDVGLTSNHSTSDFAIGNRGPTIAYVAPTDDDKVFINRNWTYINTSVANVSAIDTFIISWNSTYNITLLKGNKLYVQNETASASNLVGFWHFDNATTDATRFANNLNNTGVNCSATVSGYSGTACRFGDVRGSALNYSFGSDHVLASTKGNLTIEAWINLRVNASVAYIATYSGFGDGGANRTTFSINSGQLSIAACGVSGTGSASILLNRWHHVVQVYNGTHYWGYVDGRLDLGPFAITAQYCNFTSYPLQIGQLIYADGSIDTNLNFNGTIDEVMVWNRTLSAEEIADHAMSGRYYINKSLLKDGNYSYYAWVNDTAGSSAATASRTLVVDTVVPNASVVINGGLSNTTSSFVTISMAANDTNPDVLQCRFANENRVFEAWEACVGSKAWQLSSGSGVKTVVLQARDRAGNTNETNDTIIMIVPAAVLIVSPTSNSKISGSKAVDVVVPDNSLWVTFNVTNASNRALSWNLAGTANSITNDTNILDGFSNTWATTSFADGQYNLTVMAYDVNGYLGNDTETSIRIDNTAPAIGIISPANGSTVNRTIFVSALSNASDIIRVVFEYSSNSGTDWYPIGTDFSPASGWNATWDTRDAADGSTYRVRANATDDLGNAANHSSADFTIDNTGPVMNITFPSPGAVVNGSVNVTFTGGSSTAEISIDGQVYNKTNSANNYIWNTTAYSEGAHTLKVRDNDSIGNTGYSELITVKVDNYPGVVTIITPRDSAVLTKNATIDVVVPANTKLVAYELVNASNNVVFSLYNDSDATDGWNYTINTAAYESAAGYRIVVNASDDQNRRIGSDTVMGLEFDNVAPTITRNSPLSSTAYNKVIKLNATYSSDVVKVIYSYRRGNGQYVTIGETTSPPFIMDWDSTALPDGSDYEARFNATDRVGLTTNITSLSVEIDNTPPVIAISNPIGSTEVSGTVNITFTALGTVLQGSTQVQFDGGSWAATTTNTSHVWDTTAYTDTTHLIRIRANDSLNNTGYSDIVNVVTNNGAAPVILIEPASGGFKSGSVTARVIAPAQTDWVIFNITNSTNTSINYNLTNGPNSLTNDSNAADGWQQVWNTLQFREDVLYNLMVSAYTSNGTFLGSDIAISMEVDNTDPSPPTNLTITDAPTDNDGILTIQWNGSRGVDDVDHYEVHRSQTQNFTVGTGTFVKNIAGNLTIDNVPTGLWFYRILAVDNAGRKSNASNESNTTVVTTGPTGTLSATPTLVKNNDTITFTYTGSDTGFTAFINATESVQFDSAQLHAMDTPWTSSTGSLNVSLNTSVTKEGTASLQLNASTNVQGQNVTIDLGAGAAINISDYQNITFWVYSNTTGQIMEFLFGNTSYNDSRTSASRQTVTITTNRTWERVVVDATTMGKVQKGAIRYLMFNITTTSPFLILIDDIRAAPHIWLHDDGVSPDAVSGDRSYTGSINISSNNKAASGNYTVKALVFDAANNPFSPSTTVKLDNKAPFGNITINNGNSYTSSTTVTLTLTFDDENGVKECRYSNTVTFSQSFEACSTVKTWILESTEGTRTVFYQVRDNAGNINTSSDTIILDTVTPTINITFPLPGSKVNGTVNITFTGVESTAPSITIDGASFVATNSINNHIWNTSNYAEGSHTLRIKDVDSAGNIGYSETVIVQVDNYPGTVSITAPLRGAVLKGNATIRATAPENTKNVTFWLYNISSAAWNSIYNDTNPADGWNITFDTTGYRDGINWSIWANATDDVGRIIGADVVTSIEIDNTAPSATLVTPADGVTVRGTVRVNATSSGGDTQQVRFEYSPDSGTIWFPIATDYSDAAGWAVDWNTAALADGSTYRVRANATDNAGLNGVATNGADFTIDNTAPVLVITVPANGALVNGVVTITWTGNETSNQSFISIDGASYNLTNTGNTYVWNTSNYNDGTHTLRIRHNDTVNNTGYSDIVAVTVDNINPIVTILSPLSNSTITGTVKIVAVAPSDTAKVEFLVYTTNNYTSVYNDSNASDGWTFNWDTTQHCGAAECTNSRVRVNATDRANNSAIYTADGIEVDNLAPQVTLLKPANGDVIKGGYIAAATATDAVRVSFEYSPDSGTTWYPIGTDFSSAGGWNATWDTTTVSDGTAYRVRANATDNAGLSASASNSADVIVRNALATTILRPLSGQTIRGNVTLEAVAPFTATTVAFRISNSTRTNMSVTAATGETNDTTSADGFATTWNTTQFSDGLYNLTAISWDGSNNFISNDTELNIRIDNTAPSAPVLSVLPRFSSDGTIGLNWTNVSDAAYFNIYRSTTVNFQAGSGTFVKNVSSNTTTDLPGVDAKYYYKVTAVDASLLESAVSNEENTTIITTKIPGYLAVNDTVVARGGVIKFTFTSSRLGLNVTFNSSEIVKLDFNSTELMLNDSGQNGDLLPDDGVYTAVYSIAANNNISDGAKTLIAAVNDSANNRLYPSINITLDNTIPNASVRINNNLAVTTTSNVMLSALFNDSHGVDACRFANENRLFDEWESCASTKAWRLSANDGAKTVVLQARDQAGNVNETNDTITLTASAATTIIRPVSGQIVGGNVTIDVVAPDGTATVAFRLSNVSHTNLTLRNTAGETNDTALADGFTQQWNTSLFADGLYNLTVVSWDQNNVYTSNDTEISIRVANMPPSAPTLSVLPKFSTDATIGLNWTNVSNAVYFNIYRSTTVSFQAGTGTFVKNVSSNTTTDLPGVDAKYYYKVTAVDVSGLESSVSNEENTTIITTKIPGYLAVNDTVVADGGVIKLTFTSSRLGLNVTFNSSEIVKLDFNSTELMLNDSGQNGDLLPDDGVYTAVYSIAANNNISDGAKTLIATVNDSANNRLYPNINITLDNTIPNSSVRINNNLAVTASRNVMLSALFNDSHGVDACRFANEDRGFDEWETCTSMRAWRLSANDGVKTVVLQLRDQAGNVNETNDTITLTAAAATTIIRPTAGQTIRGNVTIDVVAPDGVTTVAFRVSNSTRTNLTLSGAAGETNDTTLADGFSQTWNTTLFGDGLYNLTVMSWDANNVYVSNDTELQIRIDNTQPSSPTLSVLPTFSRDGIIGLNWTNVSDAAYFNIYRSTTVGFQAGSGTFVKNVSSNVTTDIPGVDAKYYYKVTSVDVSGLESAVSNEENTTIITTKIPGYLAVNDTVVARGGVIKFTFTSSRLGLNVTFNSSEIGKLDFNSTELMLNDSGQNGDALLDDGAYTAVYAIASNSNISDGTKTLTAAVNDSANNRAYPSVNITLDNTIPNASIRINDNLAVTTTRTVTLRVLFNDSHGVDACRFANEDRNFDEWEACANTKTWRLSANDGAKTVVLQARDNAGNVNETNDTITLTAAAATTIIKPTAGQIISGNVTIDVVAPDGASIVAFRISNATQTNLTTRNTAGETNDTSLADGFSQTWNTTVFSDGLYNLTAISWDANNMYMSNDTELQIEIDNIAPSAPTLTALPAFDADGTVNLNWTDISLSHSDVIYYNVYRSTTQNFNISSAMRIKNASTNFTSDVPGIDAKHYYKVTAVDNALHESGVSNEENTTVATGRIFGILAVNDTLVADGSIVRFTFSAPRLGLNVTVNSSQLGNLDSNSVELMLNDSGQNGDDKVDDGVYTAIYAISATNTVADGRKTITATVNDSANNRFFPSVNITLDNTLPNASIRIQGLGATGLINVSPEYTTSRNVILSLLYNDSEGIDLCRYANEDSVFTQFEPCEATKAWILSANDGNKTVLYEVRDQAGNVNRTNDTIALNTTGAGLDQTPPLAPTVTDDGAYTNTKHALHARWNSTDPENDILHIPLQYEYRISYNSSNSFVNGSSFLLVGTATELRVFGLNLDNNTNYTFEVRAINTAGIRSPTGYSDGIIVDITPPTAPGITSSHSSNWTQNSNPVFNWSSNDSISGVKAYSYVLDTNFSTVPDNVEESETEHILVNSSVNTGQQQTLKYNSTGNASAIFIEVRQNLTALDTIRLTIYAAESHVETPDTLKLFAYAISSPPTAYNMTASNITTIADTTADIAFKQSLLDAEGTILSITSSANVTAGRFYIAIAGAAEDDDNNYNLIITGSNATASINNATQSFICAENGACTNQTNTFDYGVKIERADLRGDNIWDRSYPVGDGTFYFHAKAIDNAGTWGETGTYNISVDTSAPSTPQMAQPAKTTNNSSISFEWTQSTDPHSGVDNYYLAVDNDSDFGSPDYRNWVGNVTNTTITVTNTTTTYYARVHSKNLAGVNSSLSSSVTTVLDITPPTVTYIRPQGTIVSSSTTLAVRTSERAICRYQISAGTAQNFTFTNNTYHEASVSLSTGNTISVTCYDDVNNAGTASSGSITVSALTADSVTLVPTTKTVFTDEATSIDYTVKSGSTNLGGISSESFALFLDTSSQTISVTDNGNGNYTIAFTAPATNGSMNMTGRAGTTTSAQGTLNVNNLMFTVLFVNDTLNPIKTQKMTYTLVGNNFSLGIASQSKSVSIGSSAATGLNLTANAKDSDVMVFITRPTSGVERVEDLLKDRAFLDAVVPSFGYALKQDTFIVYTELSYDSISLSSNNTLSTGRHNLVIENRGFDTTINKTKLEVRIT